MKEYRDQLVLLSTGFRLPGERLFFRRARLFTDHIELSGWYPRHSYQRSISLTDVKRVEWPPRDAAGPNHVRLHLSGAESLVLEFEDADRWRRMLEANLSRRAGATARPAAWAAPELSLRDLAAFASSIS